MDIAEGQFGRRDRLPAAVFCSASRLGQRAKPTVRAHPVRSRHGRNGLGEAILYLIPGFGRRRDGGEAVGEAAAATIVR
jgi:hypothetical protein